MNYYNQIFNPPAFVRDASPDALDLNADDAVIVGQYRIDTPAAAWTAAADIRKRAAEGFEIGFLINNAVQQACNLFNIDESMFEPVQKSASASIVIDDGEHTAEFNVFDNESLNKAASDLLKNRKNIPYLFAHDCACALNDLAGSNSLEFNSHTKPGIKKLAGLYNVDFERGKHLLEEKVKQAHKLGMVEHAKILEKLASMCNTDCTIDAAPYFVAAVDEFDRALPGLNKSAYVSDKVPEDVFYMTPAESVIKMASEPIYIDSERTIKKSALFDPEKMEKISKWASDFGYTINSTDDPETVCATVSKMPAMLRDAFVSEFSNND